MNRYIAFLRAINVGGRVVKMEALRDMFEALRFTNVETFIASGNVIFETPSADTDGLRRKIEAQLLKSLDFEVATFIRTDAEVAAIAAAKPFSPARLKDAGAFNVAFLHEPLADERGLAPFKTDIDDFRAIGRELYWLCKVKQSESTFSNALFEKKLGVKATFRGINTVAKLAAKYPPKD